MLPSTATQVVVAGLGYVGCVTAACLAHLGHRVTGVDRDPYKVRAVNAGESPFHEPELPELLRRVHEAGRLSATADMGEALAGARVVLLCVGTPSEPNGNLSVDQLRRVSLEVAPALQLRETPLVVAVRSTTFPGTCEDAVLESLGRHAMAAVVANPEFLREGAAVRDFLEPSLVVVGGSDQEAVHLVASLYAGLPVAPTLTTLRAAELIKYACNAFHAVKIGFANEMGTLARAMGIDAAEVMETLKKDTRLNASGAYLRPGFAFGGACLPKDLRALEFGAQRLGLQLPLLESVLPSNSAHLSRAIEQVLALPGAKLGIYGLAFKEDTDDLRESPAVAMLEQLAGNGRQFRVYDAHIRLESIFGANLRFLLGALPQIGAQMAGSLEELLDWADEVVLTQPPSPADAAMIEARGRPLCELYRMCAR
ncbi:MAG: nucleotide sugar dehydrogenase [Candidatus Solibacter usitatus]|nr:nucleotide sugar dehydrogenase [Candidatus Solibacter usitatus]